VLTAETEVDVGAGISGIGGELDELI